MKVPKTKLIVAGVVLGVASLCAAFGGLFPVRTADDGVVRPVNLEPPVTKVQAVYAVKDIPEGNQITFNDIEVREVDSRNLPEDFFSSSAVVEGRTAKYAIEKGRLIFNGLTVDPATVHQYPPEDPRKKQLKDAQPAAKGKTHKG